MTINILSGHVSRQLSSCQVLADISSIVKELLENALDAGANNIEITLEGYGFRSITVKDNGIGIDPQEIDYAGKRHCTSKLRDLDDLQKLASYGFRGEGLNSICALAETVKIITKVKQQPVGQQYFLNHEAIVCHRRTSNQLHQSGTIVTVMNPFLNMPVRRQQDDKKNQAQLHIIKEMVKEYALIHHQIRFAFNKSWIIPSTTQLLTRVSMLFSHSLGSMLNEIRGEQGSTKIHALIPKADSNPTEIYRDRVYIYLNQRPIDYVSSELKGMVNTFKTRCKEALGLGDQKKLPFLFLHIQIPPSEYDVNVNPNKSKVMFHHKEPLFKLMEEKVLNVVYPPFPTKDSQMSRQSIQPTHPRCVPKDQQAPLSTTSSISVDHTAPPRRLTRQSNLDSFTISSRRARQASTNQKTINSLHQTTIAAFNTIVNPAPKRSLEQDKPPQGISQIPLHQQIKTIHTPDIQTLYKNYCAYRARLDPTYSISTKDYLKHSKTDTKTIDIRSDFRMRQQNGFEVYSVKNVHPSIIEVGLLNREKVTINYRMKLLVSSYTVPCKKALSRPIQFEISQSDQLYNELLTIESREHCIKNDMHGHKDILYYDITENAILQNGFKARWRKNMDKIVVQIVSVTESIANYGTEDFRELVMNKAKRPQKVLQYLYQLAHEQQAMSHQEVDLNLALDALEWISQDSGYELGLNYDRTQTLAFRITGLES